MPSALPAVHRYTCPCGRHVGSPDAAARCQVRCEEDRVMRCGVCGETFTSAIVLMDHQEELHGQAIGTRR